MAFLEWLRENLRGAARRHRHPAPRDWTPPEREVRDDPSGPHHFGRRAHRPDPEAAYGFGIGENRPRR
jgi:hypothetical protein